MGAHSLSGRVTSERETKRHVRIVAVGQTNHRVFYSRCDGAGSFVVRYLPPDDYLVHAHDDDGGWCDLGIHRLDQPWKDCGEHHLNEGGHLIGIIDPGLDPIRAEKLLMAKNASGIEIPVDEIESNGKFRFGHLKPGKWTVIAPISEGQKDRYELEIKKGQTTQAKVALRKD